MHGGANWCLLTSQEEGEVWKVCWLAFANIRLADGEECLENLPGYEPYLVKVFSLSSEGTGVKYMVKI